MQPVEISKHFSGDYCGSRTFLHVAHVAQHYSRFRHSESRTCFDRLYSCRLSLYHQDVSWITTRCTLHHSPFRSTLTKVTGEALQHVIATCFQRLLSLRVPRLCETTLIASRLLHPLSFILRNMNAISNAIHLNASGIGGATNRIWITVEILPEVFVLQRAHANGVGACKKGATE